MKDRTKRVYLPLCIVTALCVVGWITLSETGQSSCSYNSQGLRLQYFDCDFQREWLAELPEMPQDFYDIRGLFQYNYIEFAGKAINKSYWSQPEWFPNYQENINKISDTLEYQARTTRLPIVMWNSGVYPSEFYVMAKPGAQFTVYTWIKNLAIQWKYEGFGLHENWPGHITIKDSRGGFEFDEVSQDPAYAAEHIDIDFGPREFVLYPAFPVLKDGYVRMIRVDINISSEISPGIYVTGFKAGSPSKKFSQSNREFYGFDYTDPVGGEFAFGPRSYKLIIEVEDE